MTEPASLPWLCSALARLPRPLALHMAARLADGLYAVYCASPYRHFLNQSIQPALTELNTRERNHLARLHCQRLLQALLDFVRFAQLSPQATLPPEVQLLGHHHYLSAKAAGRGVILVSAHFGCWEWIPAALALQGEAVSVLVQRPSQSWVDQSFSALRAQVGVQTLYNDSLSGLRPLIRALRQGETVGMLIDQHGESQRLIGSFFRQCVSLPEGPARIARQTGAVILPVLARWHGQRHLIQFFTPLQAQDFKADLALMQQLYDWLEAQIRRGPENWLWSYLRWDKYRP
ncbi:MAG: lysophospholipid acyltransferase family protein [Candidatus Sericytochromatia bacterium]|nr:lysophospholipid acyltransferase family protein [Candidatus Sericytochromatia bacterium]